MTETGLQTIEVVLGIIGVVIALALAGFGWMLSRISEQNQVIIAANDKTVSGLEKGLSDVRSDLASFERLVHQEFVTKDDYIRSIASMEHKLDAVTDEIGKISRDVTRLCAVTASFTPGGSSHGA